LSFGTGNGFDYDGPSNIAVGQDGAIPTAGNYTLVVGAFNTIFTTDINDITTSSNASGAYNLNATSGGVSAVPLPAGGVLLISGLMGLAATRRKKKAA